MRVLVDYPDREAGTVLARRLTGFWKQEKKRTRGCEGEVDSWRDNGAQRLPLFRLSNTHWDWSDKHPTVRRK